MERAAMPGASHVPPPSSQPAHGESRRVLEPLDRFHPGDEGYDLIARRIADAF